MSQNRFVWRCVTGADRGEQAGVEPAAMLVAAFKVEIGWCLELFSLLHDRCMRNTGVEPDIENVHFLTEIIMAATWADGAVRQELFGFFFVPDVAARLFEKVGDMVHDLAIGQSFIAFAAIEDRDRYTPAALTADTPVGTVFDHVVDAVASPVRNPLHIVDVLECFLAELIGFHGDEPLLCSPENDRFLAAPTVGVAVRKLVFAEQRANFCQLGADLRIDGRNFLPAKELKVLTVTTVVVNRVVDFESVTQAGQVVIMTMPGGGVYASGSCFEGDVVAED